MKTPNILLIFTIIFSSFICFAQENDLQKDMKSAFETFDKGKQFDDWLKGAEMMSALGNKYGTEWLPNYWASYFYSQVARSYPKKNPPKNVTPKDLLELSQKNYYASFNRVKNKSESIKSDFHTLQNLIYSFNSAFSKDEKSKNSFKEKAENELQPCLTHKNILIISVLIIIYFCKD